MSSEQEKRDLVHVNKGQLVKPSHDLLRRGLGLAKDVTEPVSAMLGANAQRNLRYDTFPVLKFNGVKWRRKLEDIAVNRLIVAGNIIYLAYSNSEGSQVNALKADDGSLLWGPVCWNDFIFDLAASGNSLIIGDASKLLGLNRTTGAEKWKCVYPVNGSHCQLLVQAGQLFAAGDSGMYFYEGLPNTLYMFDPNTAAAKWSFQVSRGSHISNYWLKGQIIISVDSHFATAIDLETKSERWSAQISEEVLSYSDECPWGKDTTAINTLEGNIDTISGQDYFFIRCGTQVIGLDIRTGEKVIEADILETDRYCAVIGGVLYVSCDSSFFAIDVLKNKEIWRIQHREMEWRPTLAFVKDILYCQADGINLVAVDRFSGKIKWLTETNARITVDPVVSNGVIYFGCEDGSVYALH